MGRLQIAEDLEFQRRTWIAERIGWASCTGILVAAMLGVFGVGPLGDARTQSPDGTLAVEYPRFARMQSPLTLRVRLTSTAPSDGALRLWLSREVLEMLSLQNITPPPDRVELDAERVTFVFAWRGDPGPAVVTFVGEADEPGSISGSAGSGDAAVPLRLFLYP